MIYTLSTFASYDVHLAPIVEALRDVGVEVQTFATHEQSLFGEFRRPAQLPKDGLWLVAGSVDALKMQDRRFIYIEHGAGQTYGADDRGVNHVSYSNGTIPGNVCMFLCPNLYVAARRRINHPSVPAVLVGSPRLDQFHAYATGWHEGVERDVVAFAWHWDCGVVPETRTAWHHYREGLISTVLKLRRRGYRAVCTAHPRIAQRVRYHAVRMGMEWWDSEDVLTRAAVLCWDNTSLGYEFASLGRPTVIMNSPDYRRDVHHGLRFWECLPGVEVDGPEEIPDAVDEAIMDDYPGIRDCIDLIFPCRDGKAAWRSAEAIISRM